MSTTTRAVWSVGPAQSVDMQGWVQGYVLLTCKAGYKVMCVHAHATCDSVDPVTIT